MASPLGPDDPSAPSTLMPLLTTSKPCSPASPRCGRCRPNSVSCRWRRGTAAARHHRRHHGARRTRASLPSTSTAGCLLRCAHRSSLTETVKALALAFLRLSAQRSEKPRRMRALVMAVGEEAIFAAAGLTAARTPPRLTPEARSPIGLISLGYQARSAFGVGLPFGRIEANSLHALADISERYGDGSVRTTPWRALLLTGVSASDEMNLRDEVTALDLITDPADPRLDIFACVGAPSCLSASVDARGDAVRLAATIGMTHKARSMSLAAANPALIVVPLRSPSSAATGATISSATAIPQAGQASQVSPSIRSKPCSSPPRGRIHERRVRLRPRRRRDLSALLRHHPQPKRTLRASPKTRPASPCA